MESLQPSGSLTEDKLRDQNNLFPATKQTF